MLNPKMRYFPLALLLLNLTTVGWLMVDPSNRSELMPWAQAFDRTRDSLEDFHPVGLEQEVRLKMLRSEFGKAEWMARDAIEQYRKGAPLTVLLLLDIAGLFILVIFDRRWRPRQSTR
jgi:hypothetical protein